VQFIFIGIFLIVLFLIGLASHSISTYLYKRMEREKEKNAKALRVVTFAASFVLIFVVITYLFMISVPWGR